MEKPLRFPKDKFLREVEGEARRTWDQDGLDWLLSVGQSVREMPDDEYEALLGEAIALAKHMADAVGTIVPAREMKAAIIGMFLQMPRDDDGDDAPADAPAPREKVEA